MAKLNLYCEFEIVRPSRRTMALLSGGIDSSIMVAWLLKQEHKVNAAFVKFGQSNINQEYAAAHSVWRHLKGTSDLSVIDLSGWRDSFRRDGVDRISMGLLARNPTLILAAHPLARLHACEWLALGSTVDDANSPDCNQNFVDRMNDLLIHLRQSERLTAPWINKVHPWNKAEIIRWALREGGLGRKFIDMTHSCWKDQIGGCGECQPCRTRKAAIELAEAELSDKQHEDRQPKAVL